MSDGRAITSFFAPKPGAKKPGATSKKRKNRQENDDDDDEDEGSSVSSSRGSSTRQRVMRSSELGPHARRLFSFLEPQKDAVSQNEDPAETKPGKEEDDSQNTDDKNVGLAAAQASIVEKTDEDAKMTPKDSSPVTWSEALFPHFASPGLETLAAFVARERETKTVYPPESLVFSALHLTPLDKVRVVVVGQDPYHGPNQAHGLSFSVPRGVDVPQSLRNMYKELQSDPQISFASQTPTHGNLEKWARQGVLMLNAVLTVRHKEPNSHQKQGWEAFTDEMIRVVEKENRRHSNGLVFLLWGRPASKKAQAILGKAAFQGIPAPQPNKAAKIVRAGKHAIIFTAHPSPLSASRGFLGSRCFSLVNEALQERGYDAIDWNVDD